MNITDQALEAVIRARGANVGPRITPADIEAQISAEFYLNGYDFANSEKAERIRHDDNRADVHMRHITICILITKNGTKLVGANEGPVSPENFDPELGRQYARQKAIDQLWPMLGYELRTKLAQAAPLVLPVIDQATLNTKEN